MMLSFYGGPLDRVGGAGSKTAADQVGVLDRVADNTHVDQRSLGAKASGEDIGHHAAVKEVGQHLACDLLRTGGHAKAGLLWFAAMVVRRQLSAARVSVP